MSAINSIDAVQTYLTSLEAGGPPNPATTQECSKFLSNGIVNKAIENYQVQTQLERGFMGRAGLAVTLMTLGGLIASSIFSGGIALGIILAVGGLFFALKTIHEFDKETPVISRFSGVTPALEMFKRVSMLQQGVAPLAARQVVATSGYAI